MTTLSRITLFAVAAALLQVPACARDESLGVPLVRRAATPSPGVHRVKGATRTELGGDRPREGAPKVPARVTTPVASKVAAPCAAADAPCGALPLHAIAAGPRDPEPAAEGERAPDQGTSHSSLAWACARRVAEACLKLAAAYKAGDGVPKEALGELRWSKSACEAGSDDGCERVNQWAARTGGAP